MPQLAKLQRIRIVTETTFGTEMSGSIASFKDLHAMMVNPAATSPQRLQDEGVVQRIWQRRKSHEGPERPTLDLRTYLAPPATALNDGAAPGATPEDALGLFIYNMMGGFDVDSGSTESGGTSTTDKVDVVSGAKWAEGGMYGCYIGSVSGAFEARQVASISTNELTPLFKHSGLPANGLVVYNAYTYFLSSDPDKSSQIIVESADRDAIHWLLGMQGVPAFEVSVNQLPIVSASMQGAAYTHDDDVATPLGGSAIAAATLTDGDPVRFTGEVLFGTGTAPIARTVLDASIQITPQWTVEPLESPSGVEGISRWIVTPGEPSIQAVITSEGFGTTYAAARDAGTEYALHVQIGNAPAGTVLLSLPRLQIESVEPADYGNVVGEQITCAALESDIASTDLGRSPIVIGRL